MKRSTLNIPPKSKGRPVGSKGRLTFARVAEILSGLDKHPVQEILALMPHLEPKDAATMWLHLLRFIEAPKLPKPQSEEKTIPILEYKRTDSVD